MKGMPGWDRPVTGVGKRLCGTIGTASRRATPVQDQNELSDIAAGTT